MRESATNVWKMIALWMRSRPGHSTGRQTIQPSRAITVICLLILPISLLTFTFYSSVKKDARVHVRFKSHGSICCRCFCWRNDTAAFALYSAAPVYRSAGRGNARRPITSVFTPSPVKHTPSVTISLWKVRLLDAFSPFIFNSEHGHENDSPALVGGERI